jgi:hypothetical protein
MLLICSSLSHISSEVFESEESVNRAFSAIWDLLKNYSFSLPTVAEVLSAHWDKGRHFFIVDQIPPEYKFIRDYYITVNSDTVKDILHSNNDLVNEGTSCILKCSVVSKLTILRRFYDFVIEKVGKIIQPPIINI